jgi:hypothetical protein
MRLGSYSMTYKRSAKVPKGELQSLSDRKIAIAKNHNSLRFSDKKNYLHSEQFSLLNVYGRAFVEIFGK